MNDTSQNNYNFSKEEMKIPKKPLPDNDEMKVSHIVILLGVTILLLLLVLAGLYLWDSTLQTDNQEVTSYTRPTAAENQEPESSNARADVANLNALSSSDEISIILADLENTNIEGLTPELDTIERSLTQTP